MNADKMNNPNILNIYHVTIIFPNKLHLSKFVPSFTRYWL